MRTCNSSTWSSLRLTPIIQRIYEYLSWVHASQPWHPNIVSMHVYQNGIPQVIINCSQVFPDSHVQGQNCHTTAICAINKSIYTVDSEDTAGCYLWVLFSRDIQQGDWWYKPRGQMSAVDHVRETLAHADPFVCCGKSHSLAQLCVVSLFLLMACT